MENASNFHWSQVPRLQSYEGGKKNMSDMQQLMKSQSVRQDVFKHKAYIQRFLIIKDPFSTT